MKIIGGASGGPFEHASFLTGLEGGYAAGSGNTIASYVPVDNYLAMMRAIEAYNGK